MRLQTSRSVIIKTINTLLINDKKTDTGQDNLTCQGKNLSGVWEYLLERISV